MMVLVPRTTARLFALLSLVLSCAAFDESMRLADDSNNAVDGGGPNTGACTMTVAASAGSGTCGGRGGATLSGAEETEPNDETPNVMPPESPRCGEVTGVDVDKIAFRVEQGSCALLEIQGAASASVKGAGVDQVVEGTGTIWFDPAKATGQVVITLQASSAASYKLVVH